MPLKIPDYLVPTVESLLNYKEESLTKFLDALRQVEPTLDLEELASQVSAKSAMGKADALEIIRLLVGLYATYARLEQTPDTVVDRLKQGFGREDKSQISPEDPRWEKVAKFLVSSLALDHVIGATSKAFDVMTAHEHVFLDARILTDLRPIFKPDVNEEPTAAVIIHLLKVHYHESDMHKELFLALDGSDLISLKKILDRAILKERSLRAVASKANIKCLKREE